MPRLYKIHEKFKKGLLYLEGKNLKVYSYIDIQKFEQKIKSFDKYLNRHLLEMKLNYKIFLKKVFLKLIIRCFIIN